MTLIAHYKFNEAYGRVATTAIDSEEGLSGNHDGAFVWNDTGGIYPGGTEAKHVRLGHSGPYAYIGPFANNLDFKLLSDMTVSTWILPLSNGSDIISFGNANDGNPINNFAYVYRYLDTGALDLVWEYGSGTDVYMATPAGLLDFGYWQHLTYRRKIVGAGPNLQMDFFINGSLIYTLDNGGSGYPAPTDASNGFLYSSYALRGIRYWNSFGLDSLRIYDTALLDAEILSLYNNELLEFNTNPCDKFLSTPYDRRVVKTSSNHFGNIITTGERSDRENPGFFRVTA